MDTDHRGKRITYSRILPLFRYGMECVTEYIRRSHTSFHNGAGHADYAWRRRFRVDGEGLIRKCLRGMGGVITVAEWSGVVCMALLEDGG